ncbi:MAG: hypothetical protein IPQ17_01645 [Xanthomonadales bacterium]|nr:hypothetical protein [Xanthomonadales bacterium]
MKSKMKTLSLAVLGMVGFGAAGAAMAACPATLQPPWSLVSVLQGTATSQTGGYDSTECRLRVALNQNGRLAQKHSCLIKRLRTKHVTACNFIIDAPRALL